MKTSFDEIKRMSFRALDAGRAPAGVDEDSAINTAWLEASGLPGLKLLGDALDLIGRYSEPSTRTHSSGNHCRKLHLLA